ncbi:MAG TPA: squalene synthase HpnC [Candidatus Acidoferrales bacterium]|nr:squalene synthase HpnC [Candidatus Acidoferrales bacterium]
MQTSAELEIGRGLPPSGCSVAEAERYTRRLATGHYENFNVASWLLPRHLHQHFYNLYAYCRWADDLGDEIPDSGRAIALLNEWDQELRGCYAGEASHPVFIALHKTISELNIPIEPFSDLLIAFRQDQTVHRYVTWSDVYGYCRYSANPVGRLVLYLCGYRDAERQRLSDATCTALQLANFWQDVTRDLEKGRIYIPMEALAAHGLMEDDIVQRRFDARYVSLMKELIARTRQLFSEGLPLASSVDSKLRVDIEMFSRGGMSVLDAIEAIGYNTLERRPSISKSKQFTLLLRALSLRLISFVKPEAPVSLPNSANFDNPGKLEIVEWNIAKADAPSNRPKNENEVVHSYTECRRVARVSASNFYYAFFMLPAAKRDALCALYAFMRLVDDVSDTVGSAADKQRGLARWRAALDAAVSGDVSGHPILPAFADTIERFKIPPRYFHDLISGAEMDLTIGDYPTFDRLREYCYRVAGTVGLTCLHVFGFTDPHAPDLAEKLGIAFQLTNMIRDVRADYEMGRIYLPLEDLNQFGVRPETLSPGPATLEIRELLEFETARAWSFYSEGVNLIPLVDTDSRAALWALVRIYSSLLRRIETRGYDVFSERVRLTKAEKTRILLRARLGWYSQNNVLEERDRDRRRPGGTFLGRRAG